MNTTFLYIALAGLILGVAAKLARLAGKYGVPVLVVFLGIGMIAGSDNPLGGIPFGFERADLALHISTAALALILFDGGLNTDARSVRIAILPASVLATAGVAATAGGVAVAAHYLLGLDWLVAFLLGSIISSTDAAAVFSILRGGGINLKERIGSILELESGLNDPMAVILTTAAVTALVTGEPLSPLLLVDVAVQLAGGVLFGFGIGYGGRWIIEKRQFVSSLYPLATLAIGTVAFALPMAFNVSGFLSVYIAGIVIASGKLPQRNTILRAHDFTAWFAQIVMFVMLGLLSFPSRLGEVAWDGLIIVVALAVFARPLSVIVFTLPFRLPWREVAYLSWIGLRGSVPVLLATMPLAAGVEEDVAIYIFNIVFFVVVISALIQGGSVRPLTGVLGLEADKPPAPPAVLEIHAMRDLSEDLSNFYIRPDSPAANKLVSELSFPEDSSIMLLVRGDELFAPRGNTRLQPGDHLYTFFRPQDAALVRRALIGDNDTQ